MYASGIVATKFCCNEAKYYMNSCGEVIGRCELHIEYIPVYVRLVNEYESGELSNLYTFKALSEEETICMEVLES
jgi:hypothetical protein